MAPRACFTRCQMAKSRQRERKRRRPVETDLFSLPLLQRAVNDRGRHAVFSQGCSRAHRAASARAETLRRGLQGADGRQGKTLTALGSYWKGRKPLILNKACILGCLLPATDDPARDLEIFEKLMAMDDESFVARWPRRPSPKEILATLSIARIADYFVSDPPVLLPDSAPVDWSKPEYRRCEGCVARRHLRIGTSSARSADASQECPIVSAWTRRKRPEEVMDTRPRPHLGRSQCSSWARARIRFRNWSSNSASCVSATDHAWPIRFAVPARFPSRLLDSAATSMRLI